MANYFTYTTPVGKLTIASNGHSITHIVFGIASFSGENRASALTNKASTQLQQYFSGKRKSFDFPIEAQGTPFQKAVWASVAKIPYGETRSYKEIAASVGNERATRAVGMANNKNPLPIVVPCHRVIGANGKPVGYAGGLKIKQFLLDLENPKNE